MTYNSRKMTVREMIENLSADDLYKLRFDLDSGGKHLRHLVEERIKAIESRPRKVCATCGTFLSEDDSLYTLTFGPPDFRKRAHFCGQDCLEYFLERLKPARPSVESFQTPPEQSSHDRPHHSSDTNTPHRPPPTPRRKRSSLLKSIFRWSKR